MSAIAVACAMGLHLNAFDGTNFVAIALIGVSLTEGTSVIRNNDGDIVFGPAYNFGEWANLSASFDFEHQIVRGFLNGQLIGEIPFSSGLDNVIKDVVIDMVGTGQPFPNIVTYVDNVSISAVPEPGTLVMLSTGILAVFAGQAWCNRKRLRSVLNRG